MTQAGINMLTPEEIAELVEIRRKMEQLQARYDAIVARAHPLGKPGLAATEVSTSSGDGVTTSARPSSEMEATPPPSTPKQTDQGVQPPSAAAPSTPGDRALAGMKLGDAVVAVLRAAGQPLPFEVIFKKLQEGGAPLPAEKPMLAVRQILYNQKLFMVERNRFRLING